MITQKKRSKKNSGVDVVQRAMNLSCVPVCCVYHDRKGRHFCREGIRWERRVEVPHSVSPPSYSGRWGEKRRREWEKIHGVVGDGGKISPVQYLINGGD